MPKQLPTLLVTGASGFIGKNFLEAVKDDFKIYGLSRRAPKTLSLITHPNIEWIEVDIGDRSSLWENIQPLREKGGVDFIVHLAGFYDFNYDENPEYERTNVRGTEFMLEQARTLNVKRFIFASSIAACEYPRPNGPITEETPADATFAYARSKRQGEKMVRANSKFFPCTIIRFGAVFSDWCEYGPLYVFISTWLSRNWKSRVLGGKGLSAIPYIHINNIVDFLLNVIQESPHLPSFDVNIASQDTPATHQELYDLATRAYFGTTRKPIHLPMFVAYMGVLALDVVGRCTGKRPFERPWMMHYLDKQMRVNSTYTRTRLQWKPTERYRVQRRLLFMVEHMKSYPFEWQKRNIKALKETPAGPNFRIYESLDALRDQIVDKIMAYIYGKEHRSEFPCYQTLDQTLHRKDVVTVFQFLSVSVRTKDRMSMLEYARQIANVRSQAGFPFEEVRSALLTIGRIIQEELNKRPELKDMKQAIYDETTFTFQLFVDEIEGAYETLLKSSE